MRMGGEIQVKRIQEGEIRAGLGELTHLGQVIVMLL